MVEVLALVTAVVVLATAVVTWRTRRQMQDMGQSVQEVHVMVNSQREAMMARLDQLVAALEASDTEVPPVPPELEETL